MTHPSGGRVDPDDLAQQVARRLADTEPTRARSSLRDSVLVARLISGVIVLVTAGVLVLLVLGAAGWMTGRSAPQAPGAVFDPDTFFGAADASTTTTGVTVQVESLGIIVTTTQVETASAPDRGSPLPVLPFPTTTAPPGSVPTTVATTTSSSSVTTSPSSTSSSTTSTTTATTSSSTSTTTTITTITTTTTEPPTTTTSSVPASTTTTTSPTTSTT